MCNKAKWSGVQSRRIVQRLVVEGELGTSDDALDSNVQTSVGSDLFFKVFLHYE